MRRENIAVRPVWDYDMSRILNHRTISKGEKGTMTSSGDFLTGVMLQTLFDYNSCQSSELLHAAGKPITV